MDDLTRRIQQQNTLNYQRTQKQKKEASPPPLLRIGEYHPETGRYKVLFPNDGQVIAGVKLFDSSVSTGTPVRSTRAYGAQSIGLDYKNYQPIVIPEEEPINSTPETQELPPPATTCVTIAGISIDERGFADIVIEIFGDYNTNNGGLPESVILDKDVNTSLISKYPDEDAFIRLGFFNPIKNISGDNIVLFELGVPDLFKIIINGITKYYLTRYTGYITNTILTRNINIATVDLDDFGIPSGGYVNEILIGMGEKSISGSTPDLSLVAALCPL
jgi:hypothetical protein